ncbi:MAG: class A beta-lactamase-related serine hydrolase [Candidatus Gottesmanbacteria bacterium]|nr:class A beta-lactamase-related serine hydrolase [Candidatus Gottesmanbacteria bacterium]
MSGMKLTKIIFFSCIGSVGLYFLLSQLVKLEKKNLTRITSPLTDSAIVTPAVRPSVEEESQTGLQQLKDVVDNALTGTTGTYGIVIRSLKTGETFCMNEHKVFDPASLYKLWVMVTVYEQIQNGQLQENQILSQDVSTLNKEFLVATDSAERTEGTITFTVHDALTQMITISDNYAALLLSEKIRLSSVATFLRENGLSESTVGTDGGSPTVTPSDIALFFEKLYQGQLANQHHTDEMINLLKNQKLNEGIPKYLPDQSEVAHKTGEIDAFKHDAGIVYTDSNEYIIIVMSDSDNPPGAQERIALISKAVFDYFTNKQ